MPRRLAALLPFLAILAALPSWAQTYPSRSITLIVPFAAGGPTDALGRVLGQDMGGRLGQSIVVENRVGATGSIGQDFVSKAAPDGYTLVMITSTSSNNYHLMHRSIDFVKDFSMIGQIYRTYTIVAVNPAAQGMAEVHNLTQLIAYARAHPNELNFTSAGTGSMGHLAMEDALINFKVDMQHINFKGEGLATQEVLSGRIPILSATFTILPQIKAGKLRAIAIGTPKRAPQLPDVATFMEQGVPNLVAAAWVGLAAPPNTPRPIIDRLAHELQTGVTKPETAEKIQNAVNQPPEFLGPAEFTAYATHDWEFWGKVIQQAGIKGE